MRGLPGQQNEVSMHGRPYWYYFLLETGAIGGSCGLGLLDTMNTFEFVDDACAAYIRSHLASIVLMCVFQLRHPMARHRVRLRPNLPLEAHVR